MLADAPIADVPGQELWQLCVPLALAALAVYLLLPRPKNYPRVARGARRGDRAALPSAGSSSAPASSRPKSFSSTPSPPSSIAGGVMMLAQTNPVHAALSFALVVLSSCGLFLLQAAPF